MSDTTPPDQYQALTGAASPEELEAAQAANEADALSSAQAELAVLQAKNTELADSYLRAKAEAENARRRAAVRLSNPLFTHDPGAPSLINLPVKQVALGACTPPSNA